MAGVEKEGSGPPEVLAFFGEQRETMHNLKTSEWMELVRETHVREMTRTRVRGSQKA